MHYDDHPNDLAMREHAWAAGEALYESVGAVRTIRTPPYPATHNIGTARMSERPEDGVVNAFGQAHDVPNLFVSDASQFTTGAAANPTLTIVALAIRQAEYIAEQLKARSIPTGQRVVGRARPGRVGARARGDCGGHEGGVASRARQRRSSLHDRLAAVVGEEHVRDDPGALRVFGQDATPLFRGRPDVVVFPGSTAEVAGVLAVASELSLPVVPRGAGSNLSAGTIADRGGIMLALTRMDRLLELDLENLVAVCQPGLTNATLARRGGRARAALPAGSGQPHDLDASAATWPRTPAGCAGSSTA